ncbi:MAG: hypothetical protein KKH04_17955 [Proteobacteria bacterium]|nr:hypothetical protein [Pseudomonadota bacterium]
MGYREKAHGLKFKAQGKKSCACFLHQRLSTLTLIIRECMMAVHENQDCQGRSFFCSSSPLLKNDVGSMVKKAIKNRYKAIGNSQWAKPIAYFYKENK